MNGAIFSIYNKTMSGNFPKKKIIDALCLLAVVIVGSIWAFLIFDKTAQPQEGWYVVYGNMILDGLVPYVDFEFLYLPLYAYISALTVSIFGDSLLAFRVIGALLFVLIAVVTFFTFKLIAPSWIAAVGALITVFALQGDVFFIFYDYHSVFTLFTYICIYFMLIAVLKKYRGQADNLGKYLFLGGLFCSLGMSIRPQSGVMLLVFFMLFFIVLHFFTKNVRLSLREIGCFFIGILMPILLTCALLYYAGAFSACIDMVFFGGTKGSITNMLFKWMAYIYPSLIFYPLLLLPLLVYISLGKNDKNIDTDKIDFVLFLLSISFVVIGIVCMFTSLELSMAVTQYHPISSVGSSSPPVFFILGFTIVLTLFLKSILLRFKNEEIASFDLTSLFIGGSAVIISIGSATSGPLPYVGAALLFGFVFVTLLCRCAELPRTNVKRGVEVLTVVFIVFLIVTIVAPKIGTPYNWWGSSPSPYANATYTTDVDYFSGMEVTANEKYMYEDFVEKADLYLGPSDELYCYANIPIFYALADKTPTVKAVVPWFDVSRGSTIEGDLDYLKNNNPKMIVFNDHTMDAVTVHQELYGDKDAHYDLYVWLLECRDDPGSNYDVVSTYNGSYNTYLLALK